MTWTDDRLPIRRPDCRYGCPRVFAGQALLIISGSKTRNANIDAVICVLVVCVYTSSIGLDLPYVRNWNGQICVQLGTAIGLFDRVLIQQTQQLRHAWHFYTLLCLLDTNWLALDRACRWSKREFIKGFDSLSCRYPRPEFVTDLTRFRRPSLALNSSTI